MPARQQQRPRRALAEPRREQRRPAHLGGDDRVDLVGVEHEQFGARRGFIESVGQAHHDAVVGRGRFLVDAVAFAQPPAHGQRQRSVNPQPVRRMQDHSPVAQLVAETLDQQGGVGGHHGGGGALILQQHPQVVGCVVVETQGSATLVERVATQAGQLAGERPQRGAQLGGAPDAVAVPERQPGRLARCGNHQHPVVGYLGDPPAGGPQRDHVAGARLVHHLLVEFAYPRRFSGLFNRRSQVDGEHPAIGDGAAGGDGQPLRAGPRRQSAGVAVVDQSRSQLGELGGRVLSAQQVQGGLEDAARQRGERGRSPHGVEPPVGVQRLQRRRRHGVLRQDVQRVGGHAHRLDLAGQHALHADGAADQVGAVLGEQHPAGDLADLVSGPPDALQAAGHRRRRLHLDHQVDRPHVDAELQARRRHHRLQLPALERLLDDGALLLADRPVMGAGQLGGRAERLPATHDVGRRAAGHLRVGLGRELGAAAFGVNFVEPRGKSFGQPPRIGEHDRRAVRLDQVNQPCLDVGPDGVVRQVGHVGHRHLHGQLDGLGRWGSHDGGGEAAGQESREFLGRAHGRRQPDALRGPAGP